jgi:uncharacterized membrane protein
VKGGGQVAEETEWRNRISVRLALLAILTALTAVFTMVVSIPIPATQGYINLGDVGVFLSGLLLGPLGGFASGIGSALADYGLGYIHYVPITFIVKGLQGAMTGTIFTRGKSYRRIEARLLVALLTGSIVMVSGYFIAETLLYGWAAAALEVPGNLFQVIFGSCVSAVAFLSINRAFRLTDQKNSTFRNARWFGPKAMIVNFISIHPLLFLHSGL